MYQITKNKLCLGLLFAAVLSISLETEAQVKLKNLGEFRVQSLSSVEIVDYFPQKKLYLGYLQTQKGQEICLINDVGEIIIQRKLVGEDPNQITTSLNCLSFSEDGDIWVQSPYEFALFDLSFKVKSRTRYLSGTKIQIYGRVELFNYFFLENPRSRFSFATIPNGTSRYLDGRDFRNSHLIEIFEPENQRLYEIAPISDRSLYKHLDKSIGSLYFPIYTINKSQKKLYVSASIDDEIIIYDLATRELNARIKISHGEFKSIKSGIISQSSLPSYDNKITLAARNLKLVLLDGGLTVLEYVREISPGIYEKNKTEDRDYHHFRDPDYHRLIFFDQTKQLSGDIPLPKNGKLMIALPGNRLLFKIENPEVEEDFVRYEIYEVVKN
jgi:hypothetical protein